MTFTVCKWLPNALQSVLTISPLQRHRRLGARRQREYSVEESRSARDSQTHGGSHRLLCSASRERRWGAFANTTTKCLNVSCLLEYFRDNKTINRKYSTWAWSVSTTPKHFSYAKFSYIDNTKRQIADFETKQNRFRALRSRQDLFQEEGVLNMILDTIDRFSRMESMPDFAGLIGQEAQHVWEKVRFQCFVSFTRDFNCPESFRSL